MEQKVTKKRVLVIEDDFGIRLILSEKLKDIGIDVITSETGLNAVYKIKTEMPDLVLLDIMLPGGMNGFDVLEQVKADEKVKNIPVIIMTNLDTEQKTAMSIGAVDYIVKTNISFDDVVLKIQKLLK